MKIIVTGASGLLGGTIVEAFHRRGDRVAAVVHEPRFESSGTAIDILCDDLADPIQATSAIARVHERLGSIDALVCVAGAFCFLPVASSSWADWKALGDANVGSALNAILESLPHLPAGGTITCITADATQRAGAGMAPYTAAKSAILRLVEALAEEQRARRIRVNAVAPAIIDTPQNRRDMPESDPREWTSPAAIADLILFLTSDAARAVSGAVVRAAHNK